MSLLSALGNVLDIPGSMLRDVATLNNPADQLFSPFSSEGRASESDVLDYWGMPNNGLAQLATGMALDPLTYIGIGPAYRGAKAALRGGYGAAKAGYRGGKTLLDQIERLGVRGGTRKMANRLRSVVRSGAAPASQAAIDSLPDAAKAGMMMLAAEARMAGEDGSGSGGDRLGRNGPHPDWWLQHPEWARRYRSQMRG